MDLQHNSHSDASVSTSQNQQSIRWNQGVSIAEISGGQVVFKVTHVTVAESGVTQTTVEAESAASSDLGPNPYQGLEAFQEKDQDRFFGRSRHIDELWQQMRDIHEQRDGVRLLPLYGPSGSGKSSLALAGLVPRLAAQPLAGYARAKYIRFFPDESPVNRLAGALAWALTEDALAVKKQREIAGELKQPNGKGQYDGLRRTANQFLDATGQPLIVLIDQFEELFTRCQDEVEQNIFINNLLLAAKSSSKSLWVILTLRSDFLGEVQTHSELSARFSSQGYLVPGLTRAELWEAITQPAQQAGYVFDEATVQLLIDQAADRTGALPLLQFALEQIWEGLPETEPAKTLQQIGGVGGALANKAQEIYEGCSEEEKAIARRIFLGLIQLGEGTKDTRRRVHLASLVTHSGEISKLRNIIDKFSSPQARLITVSSKNTCGAEMLEVTHEALINHWKQLETWLDQHRETILQQRGIETIVQEWIEHDHDQDYLLDGRQLAKAKRFSRENCDTLPLSEQAQKCIRKSILKRRLKIFRFSLFFIIPVLFANSYFLLIRNNYLRSEEISKAYARLDSESSSEVREAIRYLTEGCGNVSTSESFLKPIRETFFGNCRYISHHNFSGLNLSGVSIRNFKAYGIDFEASIFSGNQFNSSRISSSNFKSSRLNRAYFIDSELFNVSFQESKMFFSFFNDSLLRRVSFKESNLNHVIVEDAIINEGDFNESLLRGVSFDRTRLASVKFDNSKLINSSFDDANIARSTSFDRALIINSSFVRTKFEFSNLQETIFIGTDLSSIQDLDYTGTRFAPYFCGSILPQNSTIHGDRDCKQISEILVEQGHFASLQEAKDFVTKIPRNQKK
jgi:uncharacterized protein YjbI with pentapeptide repeats/energy-coupling factor transporter ATP-binding protein EcfA2